MPIAWHLTKVCVYHNTALKTMRIGGYDIPFCWRCAHHGGRNAKRAVQINSSVNKELGKENFVPLWKGKRPPKILNRECRGCGGDFQVTFSKRNATRYCPRCRQATGGRRLGLPCPKTHGGSYLLETKNLKKQRMSYAKHKTHRIQTP